MQHEKSAGAVLFHAGNVTEYLLLHYESGHWDFPKGHVEKGESETDTVRREVMEETGISNIKIIPGFMEALKYFYKRDKELMSKDVVFFLCEAGSKDVKLSFEHIGFKWLPFNEALELLTFKNAKEILKNADNFISGRGLKKYG
ncbi:MAG: NUDIX domain-containing protein [Candidatus Aenigmatarchaeota archaeon]